MADGSGPEENNPLGALRRATRDIHRRLDEGVNLDVVAGSVAAYRRHLTRVARAEIPLARLVADAPVGLRGDGRPHIGTRAVALAADIADLGGPRPRGDDLDASLVTRHHALGVLYVLEGSAFGNAVVLRAVRRRLGEGVPARYLAWPGDDRGVRFAALARELRGMTLDQEQLDEACDGACVAFRMFHVALVGSGPVTAAA